MGHIHLNAKLWACRMSISLYFWKKKNCLTYFCTGFKNLISYSLEKYYSKLLDNKNNSAAQYFVTFFHAFIHNHNEVAVYQWPDKLQDWMIPFLAGFRSRVFPRKVPAVQFSRPSHGWHPSPALVGFSPQFQWCSFNTTISNTSSDSYLSMKVFF